MIEGKAISIAYNKGNYQLVDKEDLKMTKKFVGNVVSVSGGNKKLRDDVFEMAFWYIDKYMKRFSSLEIDINLVSDKTVVLKMISWLGR